MSGNSLLSGLLAGQQFANNLINAPAQYQLLKDNIALANLKKQNPLMFMPGPAGQVGAFKYLQSQSSSGDNQSQNPYANMILQQLQDADKLQSARSQYYQQMANHTGQRYAPAIVKEQQYATLENAGYSPSKINTMTDQEKNEIVKNIYDQNPQLAQEKAQELESLIQKQTIPVNIQNQRYKLETAKSIYNEMLPFLRDAAHYTGLGGEIKRREHAAASQLGLAPQQYTNYLKFQQNLSILGNEIRSALGTAATIDDRKTIEKAILPPGTLNAKEMIEVFNNIKKILDRQRQILQTPLSQLGQLNLDQIDLHPNYLKLGI